MIECAKGIINLTVSFINSVFSFQIEFTEGNNIAVGLIVLYFVVFILILYFILRTVGVVGGDNWWENLCYKFMDFG